VRAASEPGFLLPETSRDPIGGPITFLSHSSCRVGIFTVFYFSSDLVKCHCFARQHADTQTRSALGVTLSDEAQREAFGLDGTSSYQRNLTIDKAPLKG
jgi:hypothetical protein